MSKFKRALIVMAVVMYFVVIVTTWDSVDVHGAQGVFCQAGMFLGGVSLGIAIFG